MIVELDGSQHVAQAPYDANRDRFLRSNGFRVLRFWNGDVLSQIGTVVETIYGRTLRLRLSPSGPAGHLPRLTGEVGEKVYAALWAWTEDSTSRA
jgi:hypothetical protein